MKTTIVVAALLAATPAFAQYGSSYGYGQGSPGATMQDYRLGHHRAAAPVWHHPAARLRPHPLYHMNAGAPR